MQRKKLTKSLAPNEWRILKNRMLNWSTQFSILLFLDTNNYPHSHSRYECLIGVGNSSLVPVSESIDGLNILAKQHHQNPDWLFGHICYELKDQLNSKTKSTKIQRHNYPLAHFFSPHTVCYINNTKSLLCIESFDDPQNILIEILESSESLSTQQQKIQFYQRTDQDQYIQTVSKLREHIAAGDCYEINYCCEGYAENVNIDPVSAYTSLTTLSSAPFAAYYRLGEQYMMSASPERYLVKSGSQIVAQPMKGTIKRGNDKIEDEQAKNALRNSIKEQAENVMIVDLMRNDLARSCKVGSIKVDELFGIYSFPQVHQMISSISGILKEDFTISDILRYSFPMGSMTGAPKIKVMELIETYENFRRQLFSGSVGYISPDGNCDFNVIIRSLFYNRVTQYLSYATGGAITFDSDPLNEWEEMRLKAASLERIFAFH
ncbi:MAG: anthranilate synthase component I family protein [Bacteroidetes bacterium]|nr:anthranilate synthase component I family protein [Bacteroidota bacterium]